MTNIDDNIDIKRFFQIIRKYLILIILVPLVFGIIGYIISSFFLNNIYQASTTLLVNSNKSSQEIINQSDVSLSKSLVYTYAEIAKSNSIINTSLEDLNIELQDIKQIKVYPLKDTQIIKIIIEAENPNIAVNFANSIASNFSKQIIRIAKVDSVEIIDLAESIPKKVFPNIYLNTIVSFIISMALIISIVILKEITDKTIKTKKDIENNLSVPLIGVIVKYNTEVSKSGKNYVNRRS